MPTRRVTAVAATLAAVTLAGCGGGSGTAQTGQQRQVLTPGGGKGATEPPIATNPNAPPREALNPPAAAPLKTVRVPVLTYHRVVGTNAAGLLDLKVDPSVFLATLQAIKAAGYHTISDARLFDALYRGRALPPKPLIISVDDGYVDDVRTILPDLQRERMVATFFVITGRMTEPGFLDGAQIVQLDRAGMDVGDHSAHHVDLRRLTAAQLGSETLGSRRVLQRVLQHFVYTFAYPFGYYDATVLAAVRKAGYTMAFTTGAGTTESTGAPLTMPRIHVGRSASPSQVVALLGG
jgi:peptidoglycan/xylan/chitin deacetylase (PgdA/CDA1 family)